MPGTPVPDNLTITITRASALGSTVTGSNPDTATAPDYQALKEEIYRNRLVVLKDQQDITPPQSVELGHNMGTIVPYYEKMYAHPENPEIYVSNSVPEPDGTQDGVPKTGKFWHSNYPVHAAALCFYRLRSEDPAPGNRGTFFIGLAQAYASLSDALKAEAEGTVAEHSVRRFYKIRPEDVYRPYRRGHRRDREDNAAYSPPTVATHPVTGEKFLYNSEGAREAALATALTNAAELASGEPAPRSLRAAPRDNDCA